MRKLLWFTIGFAAAMAIACYLLFPISILISAVCFFLIGFLSLIFLNVKICKIIAVCFLGVTVGFGWFLIFETERLSDLRALDGESWIIEIEAVDYSFQTQYGNVVDGNLTVSGKENRIRLYYQEKLDVKPGDRLKCRAQLRYTPEGGAQTSTYHKGDGIFLLGYTYDTVTVTPTEKLPVRYYPAHLRKMISQRITDLFPESTEAFACALLLGDDTKIDFQDNIAFQKSGIRHVIAVSGLHVSMLFSIVYFLTGKRKLLTLGVGLPMLLLFAAVAGFSPSIVRACIMQAMIIISVAVDKEYDPPTALAFSALVLLLVNPWTITSVSFQLSLGSMVGIFAFSNPIQEYLRSPKRLGSTKGKSLKSKLKRWFIGSVSISISALVVTLPLCALYFGTVSLIGIITNLITLWVISFVFCGIMIACVASLIWMPLGYIAAWIVSAPIQYVLLCVRLLSRIPFGVAYTGSFYTVLWIVFCAVLVTVFWVSKRKSPILLVSAVLMLYSFSLLATWLEPFSDNVRLTVIDVGQGQCILLQSREQAYLIDCGGQNGEQAAEAALSALGSQGIMKLDGIILTHYDDDHANGALYLTQVFSVEKLYLPDTDQWNTHRRQLVETGIPIQWINKEQEFVCGKGKISIFPSETETKGNESSLCILFQSEKCDILITGDRNTDGERELLENARIPNLEVLVAGHHGSEDSTGAELLKHTQPELVVISVGKNNRHGHPEPELLKRLDLFDCQVLRTDQRGNITIRG